MVLQFMLEGPRPCTILCFNIHIIDEHLNRNVSVGQLLQHISKSIAVCARSRPKKMLTKTSYKHNWPKPWSRYLSKVPPRILTASRFIFSVVHSSDFVDFLLVNTQAMCFCLKMGSPLTDVSVFTRRHTCVFKAMHFRPFTMKRMCFQKLHPFTVVTNDFDCVHVDDEA